MRRWTSRSRGSGAGLFASVVVLIVANFFIPRLMPGNPLDGLTTSGSPTFVDDPQTRDALAAYYDLDESLPAQFVAYLAGLVRADLGRSITFNRPVADVVADALPWTLLLVGVALVVATTVGVAAGTVAGWRRHGSGDRVMLGGVLAVANVPSYLLATGAVFLFGVRLGWFPISGARTPFERPGTLGTIVDISRHVTLPALALAVQPAAYCFLVMRGAMVDQRAASHLLVGRAKGLTDRQLRNRYAACNALLPVVTLTALQVRLAVTGTILVETVFAYPGLGRLFFTAIASRDYPVLQACFLVSTALVLAANAGADALGRRLDPRVRS